MPKILAIESIFKTYANITPISLRGIEIHQLEGFASNDGENTLTYKPYFLYVSSDDEKVNGSILGINNEICFFFSTIEEAEIFYTKFLDMLTTNFFACEPA